MNNITKYKKTRAFTFPEFLTYTAGAAFLYMSLINPLTESINAQNRSAKRETVLIRVQHAKNQFDQESNISEKRKFNKALDRERYNYLAPILKEPNPLNLVTGSGINGLVIGDLGAPVNAD